MRCAVHEVLAETVWCLVGCRHNEENSSNVNVRDCMFKSVKIHSGKSYLSKWVTNKTGRTRLANTIKDCNTLKRALFRGDIIRVIGGKL